MIRTEEKNLLEKYALLVEEIRKRRSALIALSGGVDSSLAAYAAKEALGENALAVTAESATLPSKEMKDAREVARKIGIKHLVIKINELEDPDFVKNPPNRCYFCKKGLSTELRSIGEQQGISTIIDGTNADDLHSHRPGALALSENKIYSPLVELGFRKEEIRKLARRFGLPTADKPSMACLSSRIPYGETITLERLVRVDRAESYIRSLLPVQQLRVRDHSDMARIEVGSEERHLFFDQELMSRIGAKLRSFGYKYVTLDMEGYRYGSLNESLTQQIIPAKKRIEK